MATPDAADIDDLLAEWEDVWLDALKLQIYDMNHRREVHDEFMELLEQQDHPDTYIFGDCFHHMYVEAQVLAIRRQVDKNPKTLSLRRLIGQLDSHRQAFTRSWFVARWMGDRDPTSANEHDRGLAQMHLDHANIAFDTFTDESGDERLGGRRLHEDLANLDEVTEKVVAYANAVVGHTQRASLDTAVTYDDFHAALEHVSELLQRYYLLINQGGRVTTTPVIQGDWKGLFRQPLL